MPTNAEVVRDMLAATSRRDVEAVIACIDPEFEGIPITAALEGTIYRGHAGMRHFVESLELDWEVFEPLPELFYEVGDRVLALGTWHARGRGGGVELTSQPAVWLADMRAGRILRWRTYTDRTQAFEELGISEAQLPAPSVLPS